MEQIEDNKTTAKLRTQRDKYAKKLKMIDENLKLRDAKKDEIKSKARIKKIIEIGETIEKIFEYNVEKNDLSVLTNFLQEYKKYYFSMIGIEKKSITPKEEVKEKIYLSVPINEKEEAKELGARWDVDKKEWYTLADNPHKIELFKKWSKKY